MATAMSFAVAATVLGLSLSMPAGAAASTGLNPLSLSFPSAQIGWVLGLTRCDVSHYCFALDRTSDGGRSWDARTLPPLLQVPTQVNPWFFYLPSLVTVTFANGRDGWIYGDVPTKFENGDVMNAVQRMWSTTDGGASWAAVKLARLRVGTGVLAVAVSDQRTLLAGTTMDGNVRIYSSTVGSNAWHPMKTPLLEMPAGGTTFQGAFVTAGTEVWFIAGNDRGVTASAKLGASGTWTSWAPPCASSGYSFSVPYAMNSEDLIAQCEMGGYQDVSLKGEPKGAVDGSQWLYSSNNGGATFHADLPIRPMNHAPYWFTVAGLPAEPSVGVILTTRPVGSQNVATLIESTDAGASWRTVFDKNILGVTFTSDRFGLAIAETSDTSSELICSHDEGRTWTTLNAGH